MKFTIIAVGTRGDLQPAVVLGKMLQTYGHRVRIFAGSNFCSWVEEQGLEAAPTALDMQALMESAGGKEWVEKSRNPLVEMRLMKRVLDEYGWQMVSDAWQACQGTGVIISSFTSNAYATAMAEKLEVPQIGMALQPMLFATRDGRSVINGPFPGKINIINYWFGKLALEPAPWQLFGDLVSRLRRELGLPPQTRKENLAIRKQLLILQAYSRHVVPHPADWPANTHTTDYWFLDDLEDWQPSRELMEFLERGPAPVYIGFGSMTGDNAQSTTRLVMDALRSSGRRAIMASGWAGLGSSELPDHILAVDYVPHSWLFPRMAAVVHHGGAGTTAAGVRAGVPSVIIPHFVDQPYWGRRVHALGVGPKPVPRRKLTAEKLARAIDTAVSDADMKDRAATLGQKIRTEDGPAAAWELISSHLGI